MWTGQLAARAFKLFVNWNETETKPIWSASVSVSFQCANSFSAIMYSRFSVKHFFELSSSSELFSPSASWLTVLTHRESVCRRIAPVTLQGIVYHTEWWGNFPTSPSTCPTSPLVTANDPPVFCPDHLRSVTDEQYRRHWQTISWSTDWSLVDSRTGQLARRLHVNSPYVSNSI